MTSPFGVRLHPFKKKKVVHLGIDLKAPIGTPIYCPLSGVVVYAAPKGAAGNYIEIKHKNGYSTRFLHLSRINVKLGDVVSRGEKIGETGNSGRSTGAHLHLEVIDPNKKWINPEMFRKNKNIICK